MCNVGSTPTPTAKLKNSITMSRVIDRIKKIFNPDGFDEYGQPYWYLPSDRKTFSYEEWYKADVEYWKDK